MSLFVINVECFSLCHAMNFEVMILFAVYTLTLFWCTKVINCENKGRGEGGLFCYTKVIDCENRGGGGGGM